MAKTPATTTNGNGVTAATEGNKKQQKASISYLGPDSEGKEKETNSPVATSTVMRVTFANKVIRNLNIGDMPMDKLGNAPALQGFATRVQRSYQTEKEIDKCIEAVDETFADLLRGVWVEYKPGAPRVTLLATAIKLSLEAQGETVDEARMSSIIEKLKVAANVEKAMGNTNVVSQLQQLKLAAQQERARDAKKAAKENPEVLSDF